MLDAVRRRPRRAPTRWRSPTSGPGATRTRRSPRRRDLAEAIDAAPAGASRSSPRARVEATADALAEEVRAGDVVLVMGGGASYRIGERLLERLEVTR